MRHECDVPRQVVPAEPPALGGVIARFGPVRVSQAGLVASAVGLGGFLSGTPVLLLASAMLLGLAYGPSAPAASLLLLRLTPPHLLNVVFSIRQTGLPIGEIGRAHV